MRGLPFLMVLCLLVPGAAAAVSHESLPVPVTADELASGGAIFRLAPMPGGCAAMQCALVDPLGTDLVAAGRAEIRILGPMVMRGRRLLPVVIVPQAGAVPDELRLEITWSADRDLPAANQAAAGAARGFHEALRPVLLGPDKSAGASSREGSYLIITAPEYLDAI